MSSDRGIEELPPAMLISNEGGFAAYYAHDYEHHQGESAEYCSVCGIAWWLHPYAMDPRLQDPDE